MIRRPERARRSKGALLRTASAVAALMACAAAGAQTAAGAQDSPPSGNVSAPAGGPIAIVPVDSGATVTGALQVTAGKTLIVASGSVTSGDKTTEVTLPHRGMLRVCASTTVKLASDKSVPAGEMPGLMMALDHGAVEADFAAAQNSDVVLTPDFRILISGPGAAEVKVRLGQRGDTCVDNPGQNAPYVLVSSVFDGGAYRVQPGQRVMFQHGSLQEVVDQEKEPCGCPPAPQQGSNEFPAAQSAGLAPLQPAAATPAPSPAPQPAEPAAPAPATPAETAPSNPATAPGASAAPAVTPNAPLVYPPVPSPSASTESQPTAGQSAPDSKTPIAQPSPVPASTQKPNQPGFFRRVGRFFRRLFGAE